MKWVTTIVEKLRPFRDLIVILVALASTAYGAVTYFATADQLARAKDELERMQERRHGVALTALNELRCYNTLNRELLRAELEEFRLTTLLQKNIADSELLRGDETEFGRVTFANLSASRDTLGTQLGDAHRRKREALLALRDGKCETAA